MSLIDTIIIEVEKFNDSIKKSLNSKKISNTKESERSLNVNYGSNFVQSIGIFYLELLDTGRGSGKYVPIEPLKKWARTKFNVDDDEAEQIAYAVSKKIYKLGTEIFRNNKKGIELDKKIVTLRKNINEAAKEAAIIEVNQKLDRFKKLHKNKKYII